MSGDNGRIGAIARAAGVNVQTIRYYERRGILAAASRSPSGYRQYPPETVRLIRFVQRAQGLGFTLREVQELLRLRAAPRRSAVRSAASAKLREIDGKIADLRAIRQALARLLRSCPRANAIPGCPILGALEHGRERRPRP